MIPSVPTEIREAIEKQTGSVITGFSFLGGGCINHGGKLTTADRAFFLKWNNLEQLPGMFQAEAEGLTLLGNTNTVYVPRVEHAAVAGPFQFLLLEYIEAGPRSQNYWVELGTGLAGIHRCSAKHFGLDCDNYIGSLPQRNKKTQSWAEFFIEQRLGIQLALAAERNKVAPAVAKMFDALFGRLASLLPEEAPALLHGDLWSGNVMTTSCGTPCLIDPAVYYGNREADLAMTQLFGGFAPVFLESYNDAYPLPGGYEERFDIYNLYPLLVHVNLFGGGYTAQLASILKRFV